MTIDEAEYKWEVQCTSFVLPQKKPEQGERAVHSPRNSFNTLNNENNSSGINMEYKWSYTWNGESEHEKVTLTSRNRKLITRQWRL